MKFIHHILHCSKSLKHIVKNRLHTLATFHCGIPLPVYVSHFQIFPQILLSFSPEQMGISKLDTAVSQLLWGEMTMPSSFQHLLQGLITGASFLVVVQLSVLKPNWMPISSLGHLLATGSINVIRAPRYEGINAS